MCLRRVSGRELITLRLHMFLLDVFFPKRCVACRKIGQYICKYCRKKIISVNQNEAICPVCARLAIGGVTHPICRGRYHPDGLTGFFQYEGIPRKVISGIKYKFVFDLAGELMSMIPPTSYNIIRQIHTDHPDMCIIPVPLHPSRLRLRGFNQAGIFASHISRIFGIPVRTRVLARTKNNPTQVSLSSRSDRLANTRNIFSLHTPKRYTLPVLLVDDVYTTGATMREAARTLKRSGSPFVWCLAIAR